MIKSVGPAMMMLLVFSRICHGPVYHQKKREMRMIFLICQTPKKSLLLRNPTVGLYMCAHLLHKRFDKGLPIALAQIFQRRFFYLANTFARNAVTFADGLKRVLGAGNSKTLRQNILHAFLRKQFNDPSRQFFWI